MIYMYMQLYIYISCGVDFYANIVGVYHIQSSKSQTGGGQSLLVVVCVGLLVVLVLFVVVLLWFIGVCTLRRVIIMWKTAMVRVSECTGARVYPTDAHTHRVYMIVYPQFEFYTKSVCGHTRLSYKIQTCCG
jgi:hypothetical protein